MEPPAHSGNVNSIVKLLALSDSAKIPELKGDRDSVAFDVLLSEMHQMRRFMETLARSSKNEERRDPLVATEYERLSSIVDRAENNKRIPDHERLMSVSETVEPIERLMQMAESRREHEMFKMLLERSLRVHNKISMEGEIPF